MNAYKVETTLREDGILLLEGLPFGSGELVEVIVIGAREPSAAKSASDVEHSSTDFQNADYLAAVSATMTEWESDADGLAYHDL